MLSATSTFSRADSAAIRLKSWKMKPKVRARNGGSSRSVRMAMFVSSIQISPAVVRSRPPSIERKVVLPLPEAHDEHDLAPLELEVEPAHGLDRVAPSPKVFVRLRMLTSGWDMRSPTFERRWRGRPVRPGGQQRAAALVTASATAKVSSTSPVRIATASVGESAGRTHASSATSPSASASPSATSAPTCARTRPSAARARRPSARRTA